MSSAERVVPCRYSWHEPDTFGYFTVKNRFPQIIARLQESGLLRKSAIVKLESWAYGLTCSSIAKDEFYTATCYYRDWLEKLDGRPYCDISFIMLELRKNNLFH